MEYDKEKIERETILSRIINVLFEHKEMNIAKLVQILKSKRSTLIYYLNFLEQKGFIQKTRIEKEKTGRPTIIKLNQEKINQIKEELSKRENYTKEFLLKLKNKGEIKEEDFYSLVEYSQQDKDANLKMSVLLSLGVSSYVNRFLKISQSGEQFLQDRKQK